MKPAPRLLALLIALLLALPASAQVPAQLQQAIPAPFGAPLADAELGYSVAMNEQYIVMGAPIEGAVKIFDAVTRTPLLSLRAPNPANYYFFGHTVAISGSLVAVGSIFESAGTLSGAGSVYVFDLHSPTPGVPIFAVRNPSPTKNDAFGRAVGLSGTILVVTKDGTNSGGGVVYVYDLASATPTVPLGTLPNPRTGTDHGFRGPMAISGTRVVADGGGAQEYVYDLANGVTSPPVATLTDPNPALGNGFGTAIDISGTAVVVSAPSTKIDPSGDVGVVYVFDVTSATPATPVATLPDPRVPYLGEGVYGTSVAISGTRVVVGDYLYLSSQAGSACVFDYSSATPSVPTAVFDNPTPTNGDWFGWAVAICDGRVVVGTPYDDTVAKDAGSAYLYDLDGATPTVPATLLFPGPAAGDFFGSAVAISGTLMVIGVGSDGTAGQSSGCAYIYDLAGTTPTVPIARLANPNPQAFAYFGLSVAISGRRVVVGAPDDNTGATYSGLAYIYDLGGATPTTPIFTLHNPSPAAYAEFGASVAISGTRVMVGVPYDDTGATDAGSAYVYDLTSATPTVPAFTLHKPNPAQGDNFGSAVALSDTRAVVGAPADDTGATDAGSAYVYDLASATPAAPIFTLHKPAPAANDHFGGEVAIDGAHVVIGARGDDTGAVDAGTAYVYDLGSGTPSVPVVTLHNPNPGATDDFGNAVAISGLRVVVGAEYDVTGGATPGRAYLYDLGSATPAVPVATLHDPNPESNNYFGTALAIDGTTVVIGSPGDDSITFNKGYAYVFGPNPNDLDNNGLLDSWEIARFGNATGHLATDDDDHDGVINLLEEAFDTDPLRSNAPAVPAVVNEGGYLTMTIAKRAGVTYEVQSAGAADPAAFSAATTTVLINDATTLKARDNFPIGTTPGRFLRVKVTAAP